MLMKRVYKGHIELKDTRETSDITVESNSSAHHFQSGKSSIKSSLLFNGKFMVLDSKKSCHSLYAIAAFHQL